MVYSLIIKTYLVISGTKCDNAEVSLWRNSITILIAVFTVEPVISKGVRVVSFCSILFETPEDQPLENGIMPNFFTDLNLDQIVGEIVDGSEEYRLEPFFYHPLASPSAVHYRQEVMQDLEKMNLFDHLTVFSHQMRKVREYLQFSRDVHHKHQKMKWNLDAASLYCDVLQNLNQSLNDTIYSSRALKLFHHWLAEYLRSEAFGNLEKETRDLAQVFDGIHYAIEVESGKVTLLPDSCQTDYSAELVKTFENFTTPSMDDSIQLFTNLEMCALETKMTDILQTMHPECFIMLERYHDKNYGFMHETVSRFERELQFYLCTLNYTSKLKAKGFRFCIPQFPVRKNVAVTAGYDLALAHKVQNSSLVIPNDFELTEEERIFVLCGPNQGGKTTFARAFGQILFLASLGCPVPAANAELFLPDRIFTHFSREENLNANAGRLKDDLFRIKTILLQCSSNSFAIINELFASTTSQDAYVMGKRVLESFLSRDCVVLYITHIHELSDISPKTVSLTAQVDESGNTAKRTYTIRRQHPDGHAYANTIVEKHHLTYREIKERIKHEGSIAL